MNIHYMVHNSKSSFHALDFYAKDEKDLKQQIRSYYGIKRIPDSLGFWKV